MTTPKKIKGVKGFKPDLTCQGFQFVEGETFEAPRADLCKEGFHFCEHPLDVFSYYSPAESVYHEVESLGATDGGSGDSKISTTKIHIGAHLSLTQLTAASIEFIFSRVKKDKKKTAHQTGDCSAASNTGDYSAASNTGYYSAASNTGYYSAASNTGDRSAASNTGDRSAASNTGDYSAASNTGYRSAASNTGYYSAASNTGYYSAASNTGYYSAASNTGDRSAASNTGDRSAASNTGDYSAASNTGYRSAASNTGYYSAASVEGKESVACGLGYQNRVKGALGCWIVLAERDDDGHIKSVKTAKVDGKKIKADTWYELRVGRFVQWKA